MDLPVRNATAVGICLEMLLCWEGGHGTEGGFIWLEEGSHSFSPSLLTPLLFSSAFREALQLSPLHFLQDSVSALLESEDQYLLVHEMKVSSSPQLIPSSHTASALQENPIPF